MLIWSWWKAVCVCVSVFSMGVLSRVLPTHAGTKKEHTPPFSQVPSIMTGKVIDYTPHWADRAQRVPHGAREAQKRAGIVDDKNNTPSPITLLNPTSICLSSTFHVNRLRHTMSRGAERTTWWEREKSWGRNLHFCSTIQQWNRHSSHIHHDYFPMPAVKFQIFECLLYFQATIHIHTV